MIAAVNKISPPMSRRLLAALLLLLASLIWFGPAEAQTAPPARPFTVQLDGWNRSLDQMQAELARPGIDATRLGTIRDQLETLRGQADLVRQTAADQAAQQQTLLDALGPPPAAGAPPEGAAVAAQRQRLNAALTLAQDQGKQTDLVTTRAGGLLDRIGTIQRDRLTAELLHRSHSPLGLRFWQAAGAETPVLFDNVRDDLRAWLNSDIWPAQGLITAGEIGLALLLILAVAVPVRGLLRNRFGGGQRGGDITASRRLVAAISEGGRRILVPAACIWAVYLLLFSHELIYGLTGEILSALVRGGSFALLVSGLAHTLLAPDRRDWAVLHLRPERTAGLVRRFDLFAAYVLLVTLFGTLRRFGVDGEEGFQSAVLTGNVILYSAFIFAFTDMQSWRRAPDGAAASTAPADGNIAPNAMDRLCLLARFMTGIAVLASLLGYHNLAVYLCANTVYTGLLLGFYALVRMASRESLARFSTSTRPGIVALRRRFGLVGHASEALRFWTGIAADILLAAALALLFLLIWGMPSQQLMDQFSALVRGITIGTVTISLGDIALGIMVFAAGILLTRFAQRGMEQRLARQTHLDAGIRHSVVAGMGYGGYVLAGLLGVSLVGINLSNLALIAGALSVGIGFGLQNIVNNFVSGIILLIERPIKVGDWVVIGDKEGYVRRISVRATEIETFPRASVIIPNSEILSSAVTNWTHRDKVGRIDIRVDLGYAADLEKARDILLGCMREHPSINKKPEPFVLLRELGATAATFSVKGYVDDVERRMFIESELRLAMQKALKDAAMPIPSGTLVNPQRQQLEILAELLEKQGARIADAAGAAAARAVAYPDKSGD